jgi:hypothetical protein
MDYPFDVSKASNRQRNRLGLDQLGRRARVGCKSYGYLTPCAKSRWVLAKPANIGSA